MPIVALPAMSTTGLANINCSPTTGVCTADEYQTGGPNGEILILRTRGGKKVYFRVSGIQGRGDRNFTPAMWKRGRRITLSQIELMKSFGVNANPPQSVFCVENFVDKDYTTRDIEPSRIIARGNDVWNTMAKISKGSKVPYCPIDSNAYKTKF